MQIAKPRKLAWTPAKRKDLIGLSRAHPPFAFPSFSFPASAALWKGGVVGVDETLQVYALEKGTWRQIDTGAEEAYEHLRQQDENHISFLVEHERITAVSGCGCVLELKPGKPWSLLHRPATKDFEKLSEAVLARDPTRLVAFRGGTFAEINRTGKLKCQRTLLFDGDTWRASTYETKDPQRIDWIGPKMFFDTKRKRVVRLYGDGVAELVKDAWKPITIDGLAPGAWLGSGYVPLHDERSGVTILLVTGHTPTAGEKADWVGTSRPFESWAGEEISVLAFAPKSTVLARAEAAPGATVYDTETKTLLAERGGKVWSLELAPLFA